MCNMSPGISVRWSWFLSLICILYSMNVYAIQTTDPYATKDFAESNGRSFDKSISLKTMSPDEISDMYTMLQARRRMPASRYYPYYEQHRKRHHHPHHSSPMRASASRHRYMYAPYRRYVPDHYKSSPSHRHYAFEDADHPYPRFPPSPAMIRRYRAYPYRHAKHCSGPDCSPYPKGLVKYQWRKVKYPKYRYPHSDYAYDPSTVKAAYASASSSVDPYSRSSRKNYYTSYSTAQEKARVNVSGKDESKYYVPNYMTVERQQDYMRNSSGSKFSAPDPLQNHRHSDLSAPNLSTVSAAYNPWHNYGNRGVAYVAPTPSTISPSNIYKD